MKNLKIFLFWLPILAVVWSGCSKEPELSDTTVIEGRAVIRNTTTPLANANVWVAGADCDFTTGCSYSEVTGTRVKTDANGNYRIEFKHEIGTDYEMRASYPDHRFAGAGDILSGKVNSNMTIALIPPAWLSIRVKATGIVPLVSGDDIFISAPGFPSSVFGAGGQDMTRVTKVDAGVKYEVYHSIKRNGTIVQFRTDTVVCTPNDTTYFNLFY